MIDSYDVKILQRLVLKYGIADFIHWLAYSILLRNIRAKTDWEVKLRNDIIAVLLRAADELRNLKESYKDAQDTT